jgi:hypothetical protein
MPDTPTPWKPHHVCILLFALSFFVIAIHPASLLRGKEVPHTGEAVRVARSLVQHGTFANPFSAHDTGETAHVAPVYPFFYATLLKIFGTGYPALLILWGLNIAFLATQMAPLPWHTSRLGFGMTPGVIAGVIGAVSVHTGVDASWECFLVGLFLMIVSYLTLRVQNWSTIRRAFLLGLVWGVLVLTNPVMVLLLLTWPAVMIAAQPRRPDFQRNRKCRLPLPESSQRKSSRGQSCSRCRRIRLPARAPSSRLKLDQHKSRRIPEINRPKIPPILVPHSRRVSLGTILCLAGHTIGSTRNNSALAKKSLVRFDPSRHMAGIPADLLFSARRNALPLSNLLDLAPPNWLRLSRSIRKIIRRSIHARHLPPKLPPLISTT